MSRVFHEEDQYQRCINVSHKGTFRNDTAIICKINVDIDLSNEKHETHFSIGTIEELCC